MGCLRLTYRQGQEGLPAEAHKAKAGYEKYAVFSRKAIAKKREGEKKCLDYYPYGLSFNSYQRPAETPNKWKFQGQELQDDLGLNWYAFKWRNHQPDIGRFFNIDPLAEDYYYNSPYAFSENKVVAHVELEGLEATLITSIVNEVAIRKAVSQNIADRKHIEARKVAKEIGGIHNGKADAWRHASWSKESSETVGKTWTMIFGIAHEVENLLDGSPMEEIMMDLTNNKKGREAANTNEDLVEKAKNNELQTLDPENEVDYNKSDNVEEKKVPVKENKPKTETEPCEMEGGNCNQESS